MERERSDKPSGVRSTTEIEGLLIARRWGPSGRVLALGLDASGEVEYAIDASAEVVERLQVFLRRRVRLTGIVIGRRVTHVLRVVVVDDHDDDGERRPGGRPMRSSRIRGIGVALAATLLLSAAPLTWTQENEDDAAAELIVLTGEIEAIDYYDDGEVTSVAIYDEDRGSVLVSLSGRGRELLQHVGARVEIRGRLVELGDDEDYVHEIRVVSYKVVEPADPEMTGGIGLG